VVLLTTPGDSPVPLSPSRLFPENLVGSFEGGLAVCRKWGGSCLLVVVLSSW
jgi:hypothetical protein